MTCAKRTVVCVLFDRHERLVAIGDNGCLLSQERCPRLPGEGYDKCESVCLQDGHAEIQALRAARGRGHDLTGGTAYILNHYRICDHCRKALTAAGITSIVIPDNEKWV